MVSISQYAFQHALIKTFLFIGIMSLLSISTYGQTCSFDDCASDDCGSLNVKFTPQSGPVFCDGETIVFENSSDTGFHYFVVDWRDGTQDTLYNNADFIHTYTLPDSVLCMGGDVLFFSVCFKGVRVCPAGETCQSGTYSIGIRKKPKALFGSGDVCLGGGYGFVNLSCHAYTAQWEFGDGNGSYDKDPTHYYDSLGNYVVRLIVTNACGADTSYGGVAVVLSPEAGFTRKYGFDAYCDSLPVVETFTNASNAFTTSTKWTIIPQDSLKWKFTDSLMTVWNKQIEIAFLDTGMYIIQLRAANDCGQSFIRDTLYIFLPPDVAIYSPPQTCDSVVVSPFALGFTYDGPIDSCIWTFNKTLPETRKGFSFSPVVFYESGSVHLTVYGPCGILNFDVPVIVPQTPDITFPGVPNQYCFNGDSILLLGSPTGGIWTGIGPASGSISPEGWFDPSGLQPGSHLFYYQLDSIQCPTQATVPIDILDKPSVYLNTVPPACGSFVYTPDVVYQGAISSYQWSFAGGLPLVSNKMHPANIYFGNAGTYPIYIQASGACGTASDSIHINILPLLNLKIQPVPLAICANMPPFYLKANYPGGTWSGQGVVDPNTGLFNPGAVAGQTVSIVYALLDGICKNTDTVTFTIAIPEVVQANDRFLCLNSSPAILQADKPGGVWSGPGIINTQFGVFDPSVTGIGTWVVNYAWKDGNGCTATDSATITVEPPPVIELQDTTFLCFVPQEIDLTEATGFTVAPSGGTVLWSGPGVDPFSGTFNPVMAGLPTGTYTMQVTYTRNGCTVHADAIITLIQLPALVLPPNKVICVSDHTWQLTASPAGGTWSGPGIDAKTGIIDLHLAGGGQHAYTYALDPGISCEQSGQVVVEIIDPAAVVITGPDLQECEQTDLLTLNGFSPAGGMWQGPGVIDPVLGVVDLGLLQGDSTYILEYCLESQTFQGCSSCRTRELRIHPLPEIDFNFEGHPCVNMLFSIQDSSDHAWTYLWDFGDGSVSTEQNPQHTYSLAGNFNLSLTVTSDKGCLDSFKQDIAVIYPPAAGFDLVTDEGCAPFPVEVISTSSGDFLQEIWIVQGDTLTGKDPGVFHIDAITSDSVFTILQQVSNLCGTEIWEEQVLVHPYPVVDFGFNVSEGCSPLSIQFSNISLGNADNFSWDMGNGSVIAGVEPPVQIYTTPDSTISTYPVTLISTNECGADTLTRIITVYPPDVRAFIELDSLDGCQPLIVHPGDYSTPGAITSWQVFDPGGSLIYATTEKSPEFVLEEVGWHTIILFAANCGEDADTVLVEVHPSPEVSFTHLPQACVGEPIKFLNASQGTVGQVWVFGDGNQSTAISPTHTYSDPGIYTVSLTGYSAQNNCPKITTSMVEILEQPTADFAPSTFTGCSPLTVNFTNLAAGSGTLGYIWTFGDGSSADFSSEPVHTFTAPGSYVVRMRAQNANGCYSDTAQVVIQVYPSPTGGIGMPPGPICFGQEPLVLTSDYPNGVSFHWSIEGQVFTSQNVSWVPPAKGVYSVTLTVGNIYQCQDTAQQLIEILGQPIADFDLGPGVGCSPMTWPLINLSVDATSYTWEIDGVGTFNGPSPVVSFNQPGIYGIRLIARQTDACQDTLDLQDILQVFQGPQAAFSVDVNDDEHIIGDVLFTNLSQWSDRYLWDLGDGTSDTSTHVVHEYDINRTIRVLLIAYNDNNGVYTCIDTAVQFIDPEWITTFYAPNAMSPGYGEEGTRHFRPVGMGIKEYEIAIYSPWGQLVWGSTELVDNQPTGFWDGTYRGEDAPQGAYAWLARIKFVNGVSRVFKGTVTVLR